MSHRYHCVVCDKVETDKVYCSKKCRSKDPLGAKANDKGLFLLNGRWTCDADDRTATGATQSVTDKVTKTLNEAQGKLFNGNSAKRSSPTTDDETTITPKARSPPIKVKRKKLIDTSLSQITGKADADEEHPVSSMGETMLSSKTSNDNLYLCISDEEVAKRGDAAALIKSCTQSDYGNKCLHGVLDSWFSYAKGSYHPVVIRREGDPNPVLIPHADIHLSLRLLTNDFDTESETREVSCSPRRDGVYWFNVIHPHVAGKVCMKFYSKTNENIEPLYHDIVVIEKEKQCKLPRRSHSEVSKRKTAGNTLKRKCLSFVTKSSKGIEEWLSIDGSGNVAPTEKVKWDDGWIST